MGVVQAFCLSRLGTPGICTPNTNHIGKNKLPIPTKDWGELGGPPRRAREPSRFTEMLKLVVQHVGFGIRIAL